VAGLRIYSSNRLELLARVLAGVVGKPLSSPLTPEVIVVQSKGMERWLSMGLAEGLGVWANCRFPFPNRFVGELITAILPEAPDFKSLSPQVLAWRIMKQMPACLERSDFAPIRNYLGEGAKGLKLLQLSERIADVFDRYVVYRPEMLLAWDAGEGADWQSELWRALGVEEEGASRAVIWRQMVARLEEGDIDRTLLPERVCVFGIPSLPRYHFDILRELSRFLDIHLFFMNPSREFWADIVPEKSIVRLQGKAQAGLEGVENLHLEAGNPLLASMGRLGRHFFGMLAGLDCEEQSYFEDPGEASLLAAMQSDILNLRDRSKEGTKSVVAPDDRSIQVHSCHSPMREVEALFDTLLDLFERWPDLEPRDILIMTPDIEKYAPFISAVFEGAQDERKKLPYSIADRRAPSESRMVDVFLKLLGLHKGRFTVSEIIDILNAPAVQAKFGIRAEEMDMVLKWIQDTRINWGIDAEHREKSGLPPFGEHSWKAGIDRLLLGYALPDTGEQLFGSILPYDDMEGNETRVLGHLIEFLSRLFARVSSLEVPRTLSGWAWELEAFVGEMIAWDDETQRDVQLIRNKVRDLAHMEEMSGFHDEMGMELIQYYLVKGLSDERSPSGFITGGIMFCEMLPMRSIPSKVVVLLGMNSDAYPREERQVGFDLIAHDPHPGDRSLRDEDRYLFLEAILSTRRCLLVSYTGQSIKDNSEIPPSVLISELLDYVEQGFEGAGGGNVLDAIVTTHRLQPWSRAYFSGDRALFSYSADDCEAARTRQSPPRTPRPFIATKRLSEPSSEMKRVTMKFLKRFYRNPARYFLNNRLGIFLDSEGATLTDDEPFLIQGLDRYAIEKEMVGRMLEGEDPTDFLCVAKALGVVPPGSPGEVAFRQAYGQARSFSRKVKPWVSGEKLPPLEVDVEIEGFRVTGRLDALYPEGMVDYRLGRQDRGRYHMDVWIDHLLLGLASKAGYPVRSILIHGEDVWHYEGAEKSGETLGRLLALYWQGLSEPLHFFTESSFAFAQAIIFNKTRDEALKSAAGIWKGTGFGPPPESEDLSYSLCFGQIDPLDRSFGDLALNVFGPLLRERRKVEK
jgi:exodeoxyribonuclease V gamma subunit